MSVIVLSIFRRSANLTSSGICGEGSESEPFVAGADGKRCLSKLEEATRSIELGAAAVCDVRSKSKLEAATRSTEHGAAAADDLPSKSKLEVSTRSTEHGAAAADDTPSKSKREAATSDELKARCG
jgi:hypothetical protein